MVQLFHQSILKICKNRGTQPILINTVQQTERNFSTEKFETFYLVYCYLNVDPMSCNFSCQSYISCTHGLGTRREWGNIQPLSSIRKPLSAIIESPGCKYPFSISDCRCWKNLFLTRISLSEIDP